MADIDGLIDEIHSLEEKAKFYTQLAQDKRAELRDEFGGPTEYNNDQYEVTASSNNRFNAKKAEALLTPHQFNKVSKRVADRKKVEALYPELLEDMLDEGALRITIKQKEQN